MSNLTIKQIAEKANISIATVSRVMNTPEKVAPVTRKRIIDILKQHNYLPNQLARGLVQGKSSTLSLVTAFPDNLINAFYFREVFMGIVKAVSEARYNILLQQPDTGGGGYTGSRFPVDGYILISPDENCPFVNYLESRDIPAVLVNRRSDKLSWVDLDNSASAADVIKWLMEAGHRDILIVTGKENVRNSIDRLEGCRKAFRDAGLDVNEQYIVCGNFHEEKAYREVKGFLKEKNRITAVFAFNDLMAFGAMRAIRESGRSIPGDISVIGFDDMSPSSYMSPALTTVRQPFYNMGLAAAASLIDVISGSAAQPVRKEFSGELILRESSSRPGAKQGSSVLPLKAGQLI